MDDDDDHDDFFARFEGGENEKRGQEIESDANWVPSYAGEAGNEAEEDEEEEKEAADEVISASRRNGKGKEKVDEVHEVENVAVSSDEYEQMDNMESDGEFKPSGDNAADENEIWDEGTSQPDQTRTRKRKRKSSNVDGEMETSRRFEENAPFTNHISFPVYEVDDKIENGTAVETKISGRKKRKFRKERKRVEIDMEGEDAEWVKSLRGPQLRLLQALKELGTERVNTIKEDALYNCLTPAALRVIGVILEEHVKERLSLIGTEPSGNGEERVIKGDTSSADEQESAGNRRSVDNVRTDQEVETHQASTHRSKSSTRSYLAVHLDDGGEVSVVERDRRVQTKETNINDRKSTTSRPQAVQAVSVIGEVQKANEFETRRISAKKSKPSPKDRKLDDVQESSELGNDRRREVKQTKKKSRKSSQTGSQAVQP